MIPNEIFGVRRGGVSRSGGRWRGERGRSLVCWWGGLRACGGSAAGREGAGSGRGMCVGANRGTNSGGGSNQGRPLVGGSGFGLGLGGVHSRACTVAPWGAAAGGAVPGPGDGFRVGQVGEFGRWFKSVKTASGIHTGLVRAFISTIHVPAQR